MSIHKTLSPSQIEKLKAKTKYLEPFYEVARKKSIAKLTKYVKNALPVDANVWNSFLPKYILNKDKLAISRVSLLYHPYYVFKYDCFSQEKAGGTIVTLESKGLIAVDAVKGKIVDLRVIEGEKPSISFSDKKEVCSYLNSSLETVDEQSILEKGLALNKFKPLKQHIKEKEAEKTVLKKLPKTWRKRSLIPLGEK